MGRKGFGIESFNLTLQDKDWCRIFKGCPRMQNPKNYTLILMGL